MAVFHRFSVAEYHRLISTGALTEDDKVELIEGYLRCKKTENPPRAGTTLTIASKLYLHLPPGWTFRVRSVITLSESEPEPDLAVVRGGPRTYMARHPGPTDLGLVIEVADSTLDGDRTDKGRIYARDTIACYWIVNLQDNQIEVYTSPSGPTAAPTYAQRQDYRSSDSVPLILDGKPIAAIPVQELLP